MAIIGAAASPVSDFADLLPYLTMDMAGLTTTVIRPGLTVLSAGDYTFYIRGSGMAGTGVGDLPVGTAGTVDSMIVTGPDGLVCRLAGLSWSFAALTAALAAESTDPDAMERFLMSGDHTYVGRAGDDSLLFVSQTPSGFSPTFAGDDLFLLRGGNDVFLAGDGNDRMYGGAGDDELAGNGGHDMLRGGVGQDILHGNDGHDLLYGGDGNDQLWSEAGNDTLAGGAGNDWLVGDTGADVFYAGDGNDILGSGAGNDTLYGGAGVDVFDYLHPSAEDGHDVIADFEVGVDKLENVFYFGGWAITSDPTSTLVLTSEAGTTVTLAGITTGSLTLLDLWNP